MYTKTVVVANKTGLHARPATLFTQAANGFAAQITVTKDGHTVDAKSILKVLSLGVSQGTALRIEAEGTDEQKAVDALVALVDAQTE